MCKCKKCGSNYNIPKNSINIGYMNYCKKCLIEASKKMAKIQINEYLELQAKQIGL